MVLRRGFPEGPLGEYDPLGVLPTKTRFLRTFRVSSSLFSSLSKGFFPEILHNFCRNLLKQKNFLFLHQERVRNSAENCEDILRKLSDRFLQRPLPERLDDDICSQKELCLK